MSATWRLVAFPLIVPWRAEFWSLPLFFPDLAVGVLRQWPQGLPYRGQPLPPEAAAGGRELQHYAPGELTQWRAYEEYAEEPEELADIVRALRGEPPEPAAPLRPGGPWKDDDAWRVAWQLEVMEAEQEADLIRVDREDSLLGEALAPETWEEPTDFADLPGDKEVLDPDSARLRYLLWRREMKAHLSPPSAPLLLGRASQAIFALLRMAGGGNKAPRARVRLPGIRSEDDYQTARDAAAAWQGEFRRLLEACLAAADQGGDLPSSAQALTKWAEEELPRLWPDAPSWSWDLEIWGREPDSPEGGETILAWGGLGKGLIPG
jgi:hypothetical protein